MAQENSKQVVIIKDIKSNFIEEAIFILKNNVNQSHVIKSTVGIQNNLYNSDAVIQEAQNIIDNYIKKNFAKYEYFTSAKRNRQKDKRLEKRSLSIGLILNIALILFVAAFTILVLKFL